MEIFDRTSVDLMTLTCVSWCEGQHDLYFTVQWFCLVSWRLFDGWRSNFGIMSPCDATFLPQNKCMSQWPIFHSPVILTYIWKTIWWMKNFLLDYLMSQCDQTVNLKTNIDQLGFCNLWPPNRYMMSQFGPIFDLKVTRSACPIFHDSVTLINIFNAIWWMNIIHWNNMSVWHWDWSQ